MDNLNEHINRFKRLMGLLVEQTCNGNCQNGYGEFKFKNGAYYKGDFKNGTFDGYGEYKSKSGKYYKGDFKNGAFDGYGILDYNDKSKYSGYWKNDAWSGEGTYINTLNIEFKGTFKDGKFNGKDRVSLNKIKSNETPKKKDDGIKPSEDQVCKIEGDKDWTYYKTTDGKWYATKDKKTWKQITKSKAIEKLNKEAKCGTQDTKKSDDITSIKKDEPLIDKTKTSIKDYKGDGGTSFHTDFVYNGKVKDGKIEGEGIITFDDRSTYSGDFKNNQIDGRGVFTFSDKSTYDGEFKTVKDDNGVSYDFTYYYGDKPKVIKDLVSHNKKSPIEQIKYQNFNPEDNPEGVQNVSDLFNVCERLDLTIKLDGDTNFDLKIVELVNVANPTIRYKSKKTKHGQIPFLDVRYGKYNVRVKIQKKGLFEQEITINDPKIIMGVDLKSSDKKRNIFNLELGRKLKTIASEYKSSGKNSIKKCEDLINSFYEFYVDVVKKNITIKQDIQNPDNILVIKDKCEECAQAYYSKFDNRTKTSTKRLSSVNQHKDYFKINAYITEGLDIYNKTEAMDFSKSIRKVLSEHSKKNEGLVIESKIIDNRFNFVFESNKDNQYKCLNNLTEERNKLIDFGYNNDIIREMFITYTDKVFKDIRDVK